MRQMPAFRGTLRKGVVLAPVKEGEGGITLLPARIPPAGRCRPVTRFSPSARLPRRGDISSNSQLLNRSLELSHRAMNSTAQIIHRWKTRPGPYRVSGVCRCWNDGESKSSEMTISYSFKNPGPSTNQENSNPGMDTKTPRASSHL